MVICHLLACIWLHLVYLQCHIPKQQINNLVLQHYIKRHVGHLGRSALFMYCVYIFTNEARTSPWRFFCGANGFVCYFQVKPVTGTMENIAEYLGQFDTHRTYACRGNSMSSRIIRTCQTKIGFAVSFSIRFQSD